MEIIYRHKTGIVTHKTSLQYVINGELNSHFPNLVAQYTALLVYANYHYEVIFFIIKLQKPILLSLGKMKSVGFNYK